MRTFIVQESKKITPSTLLLTLQRDEGERPLAFQPGQYAAISFEHDDKKSPARCFSIVSSPTDQNLLQFSMRVRGKFTTALSNLQKDDIVTVDGPFGGFVFDVARDQKAIFMAGGIGITPFMSIMRYLAALRAENDVTLFYSCATQDDVPFGDELLSIQKQFPNLKVMFVVGKGPADKLPAEHVATGFITPELVGKATHDAFTEYKYFICGPPPFMRAMYGSLVKKGVAKNRIMTEAFTQSSPRQTSILRSWPANAYMLGAVGLALGTVTVMMHDLLHTLPQATTAKPTKLAPFLVTNARHEQLDQLVNGIAPSPSVITAPTTPTPQASTNTAPVTQTQSSPPPTFAPIYTAPAPRTTASTPPP